MLETIPFPALPSWLEIEPERRPAEMRVFGEETGDLAVEFAGTERARLVTQLLARSSRTASGNPTPEEVIRELPVGKRIQAVVRLAAGDPPRALAWRVSCGSCGAESELELDPSEIEALMQEAYTERLVPVTIGSRTASMRRPTGADQEAWLSDAGADANLAERLFVEQGFEQLNAEGFSSGQIGDSIDRAMEEHDPLVGFHLEVGCPECGVHTIQAPDLLAGALHQLWQAQFDLIGQVHRLACRYHWSEEEIVKLPRWRRQAYLACVEGSES